MCVVPVHKFRYIEMASDKSDKQRFNQCVLPCPRFITGGDTHDLWIVCLGAGHALRSWWCWLCTFWIAAAANAPLPSGTFWGKWSDSQFLWFWSHFCWVTVVIEIVGIKNGSGKGVGDGHGFTLLSPVRSDAPSLGSEACTVFSSPGGKALCVASLPLRRLMWQARNKVRPRTRHLSLSISWLLRHLLHARAFPSSPIFTLRCLEHGKGCIQLVLGQRLWDDATGWTDTGQLSVPRSRFIHEGLGHSL